MITVNPVYIDYVLNPLTGGADSEESIDLYGSYNPNSEQEVKKLAREVLLPEFKSQQPILQEVVKHTLAYYLTYPKQDFERIFNSLLMPIDTPKNARLFFQWIWEVFFEGESKDYIKNEIVTEDFDVEAPLHLLTKTGGYNTPLN